MSRVRPYTLLLAVACLSGCHKHVKIAALPPPPAPPEMISVPPPTHRSDPTPSVPLAKVEPITPRLPRRSRPKYKPAPAPPPPTVAMAQPEPIALGQLTTGGETDNGTLRQQTEDLLRAQQKRLNAIPAAVVALHTQQIEQARVFLREADEAWKKLDIEGTHTLATKAKVLLDEFLS